MQRPDPSTSPARAIPAKGLRLLRRAAALRRPAGRAAAVRRLRAATGIGAPPAPGPKPAPAASGTSAVEKRYVAAWTRLATMVSGTPAPADPTEYDPPSVNATIAQGRLQHAQAQFAELLGTGVPLEEATYRTVAALAQAKEWTAAWALCDGVGRLAGGQRARSVGLAVIEHRERRFERVLPMVAELSDAELAAYLPVEVVDGGLAVGTEAARARALAVASAADRLSAPTLVDLAGRFLATGDPTQAAKLVQELHGRPAGELAVLDPDRGRSLTLIQAWLDGRPRQVPAGAIPVAIIDYQSPDQKLTSGNVGDYIQTLALMGNIVRFSGVRFTGEDGLAELATELQARVRPELRRPEPSGAMHLLDVNREFTSVEDIPAGTWMVAFGWHMHPMYDLRYDFPYHPGIRPIFVSFHINRLDLLTDEALDYLRRYGPVGCRDWTTVELLLSAGVDAFFTGCLTTTVDAVFPQRAEVYDGPGEVALIDITRAAAGRVPADVRTYTHQADIYRHMSLPDGVRAAVDLLAEYQRTLSRAVTRRLHAYLPLTALGIPVRLKPGNPGDVRFAGLTGVEPESAQLRDMQDGIRALLAEVLTALLGGADETEVYRLWRELTADQVAAAKVHRATPVQDTPTTIDVPAAVAASRAGLRRFGPHDSVESLALAGPGAVADVVLCFDQNIKAQAAVTIESLLANAQVPVRLWVLGRGLDPAYEEWLAAAFPQLPITFLPCDHIDYGKIGRIPNRITVSTMDRLLLPHLLEDVHRAIYLDIDTLVLGDIGELAALDLGGSPVAARDSNVSEFSEWRLAARRLPQDVASELQRRMGLAHGYGRAALNAGVLVLDLDRMRADGFTTTYLAWVERYGLHDQDVMLAYAGADRCVLEPRWNSLPVLEDVPDPAVIHWAKLTKPWEPRLTYRGDLWQEYADRLHSRVAPLPPS